MVSDPELLLASLPLLVAGVLLLGLSSVGLRCLFRKTPAGRLPAFGSPSPGFLQRPIPFGPTRSPARLALVRTSPASTTEDARWLRYG